MSKYTTELRFICENYAGKTESEGYGSVNSIIQSAIPKVFDFDFPIFDESYRNVLCTKILRHYYMREICEETVGLWKLRLETKLNEVMPYYNQLYKSELLEFNPLYDIDLTTKNDATKNETTDSTQNDTEKKTGSGENSNTRQDASKNTTDMATTASETSSGTSGNKRKDLYSDTPQGSLENVENETYLTNARKVEDSGTDSHKSDATGCNKGTVDYENKTTDEGENSYKEDTAIDRTGKTVLNSTDGYLQTVVGKTGGSSYSKLLNDYRETFLNIDLQVIEELSDLFFKLW
jgi:hypothetical protein